MISCVCWFSHYSAQQLPVRTVLEACVIYRPNELRLTAQALGSLTCCLVNKGATVAELAGIAGCESSVLRRAKRII